MEAVYKNPRVLAFLIVLSAFSLRLYGIDSKPFYEDEGWTLNHILHFSLPQLVSETYELLTPPLYYLLAKGVTLFLGVSEFSLRLLSVIASTLGIWFIYKTGSLCKSEKMGLMSALLLAFAPLSILYAQTARSYGLFGLWAIASFVFLIQYLKTHKNIFFLAFSLCTLLGLSTHFLFSTLLVADSCFFILQGKKLGRRELIKWFGLCLLLAFIFLKSFLTAFLQWHHHETTLNPVSFLVRILIGFFGLTLGETTYPFNWAVVGPAALLFGAAFGRGLYVSFRNPEKWNHLLLLRFLFPFIVWLYMGDEGPRHLSYTLPFFLLIVVLGVADLPIRRIWKTSWLVFLIIPQGISSYYWYSANPHQVINATLLIPWREIAADIQSRRKPDEILLLHPDGHNYLVQYYMPKLYPNFILLTEEKYEGQLEGLLQTHPPSLWLLTPPNTTREKKIRMEHFSCYDSVFYKGYVINPVLREHFKTGRKKLSYAAELRWLQRNDNCAE